MNDTLLRQWAQTSLSGIYLLHEGRFYWANAQFERDTGYRLDELAGRRAAELVHPADRAEVAEQARALLRGERSTPYECRYLTKNGAIRWARETVTALPELGPDVVLGNALDITERKEAEAQLAHFASYDPLTGLPNRALVTDLLNRALARRERTGTQVAALYLNVDDFESVNETLGQHVGDLLLAAIAKRLAPRLRRGDVLGRMGGDEFLAVVEQIVNAEDAKRVAERLKAAMQSPFSVLGQRMKVRVTIGVAVSAAATHEADDLLVPARDARRRAKIEAKSYIALAEPAAELVPPSRQVLQLLPRKPEVDPPPGA